MTNPLDRQVGGNHYLRFKIKPRDFINANGLSFDQGNVIKYVCRYEFKNGIQDLEKAKHYIEMMIADLKKAETPSEEDQHQTVQETNLELPRHHLAEFEAQRGVVKVFYSQGEGNFYITDQQFENPANGGRRIFTQAPLGRYVRQSNGIYLLTEPRE